MSYTLNLHPPIGPSFVTSVSPNGRYLLDQHGAPYLVNGDSAWRIATQLNLTDQTTYVTDRVNEGFNGMITDLITNFDITGGNTATSAHNWNGESPGSFTGSTWTPNSTYWGRIDSFMNLCLQYGITVYPLPMDSYLTVSGNIFASITTAQATSYGSFIGARYPASSYPNIVWYYGNDWQGDGGNAGYDGNAGFQAQFEALRTAIRAAGGTQLDTAELCYYESLSTDGGGLGPLVAINWAYSYHPMYEVITRGYAVSPAQPVLLGESNYENYGNFPDTPLDIRKVLLWPMTCGAAGAFYGNPTTYLLQSGWQSDMSTTIVSQWQAVHAVLAGIAWWKLQPDTTSALVTAGRGTAFTYDPTNSTQGFSSTPNSNDATTGHYVSAAYSSDGTLGVVYNPDSSVNTGVTLSSSVLGPSPTITKVDPTSGATTNLGWTTTPSGGANAGADHDWLYIITAA